MVKYLSECRMSDMEMRNHKFYLNNRLGHKYFLPKDPELQDWLKTNHGQSQGTTPEDWISGDLTRKQLTAYFRASGSEIIERSIQAIFLGYFFKWDPEESLRTAKKNGFKVREEGPKVGYYNYSDIDCDFISIHHYF